MLDAPGNKQFALFLRNALGGDESGTTVQLVNHSDNVGGGVVKGKK